jgi:GAF domain-containing protein
MVTVSRFDELGEALQDGEATWLGEQTARAFGARPDLEVLCVPMLAAGELLGALLIVADERDALNESQRRLARSAASTMAFALLRERLQGDLRDPGTDR